MNEAAWYLARAGGMVAFALIAASVALGLLMSLKVASPRWPRSAINELHRFTTVLALVFSGVHVLALLVDTESGIGLVEALVPFAADTEPLGVAMGIVALQLAVAIWLSTYVRHRIGYARWRQLHYLTFVVFGLGLLHGLLAGTDTGGLPATLVYLGALALIGPPLVARMYGRREPGRPPRTQASRTSPPPVRPAQGSVAVGPAAAALPPLHSRRSPVADGLPPLRGGRSG